MSDVHGLKQFGADWICPVSAPPVRDAVLVVGEDRIEAVTPDPVGGVPVERFAGCAIIPGFVNVHTHLELTLLRGFLEGLSFIGWIRTLTRAKYELMSPDDLRVSADLGAVECLRAGVTTLGEVMDVGTGWGAMNRFGLRGVAYQETFGPSPDAAGESIARLRSRIGALRPSEDLTRRVGVSPHAPYTVSRELYEHVRDFAVEAALPVAVHIGESREEGDFVRRGEGPFARHLEERAIPVGALGVSPIRYMADVGLLGEQTLAIHAIDVDASDVQVLRESRTAIAHCPKSNSKLGHAIAPVDEFLKAGLRVGLGSDSVASNNVVDMFEEMRTAIFSQRTRLGDPLVLSSQDVFHMATLGGARCLGLESELGSLDAGKLADFVVVDLSQPALQPVYDPIGSMVFSASRRDVRATFLGGQRVEIDAGDLLRQAREAAERIAREALIR